MSCDCSIDPFDTAAVFERRMVKGRKPHVCCECREVIPVGVLQEHFRGRFEGHWSTYRTCLGCLRIRDRYCPGGWMFGDVAQQIEDCIGFNYVTGREVGP